ncbi:MAG: OmpA family protein [Oxalobacteraceae bacterium]|nr:MAG: OmpA family protein [Oxalobacteraceae bacterium]
MADPHKTDGAPPRSIHIEKKKVNWLAWIALIAGILALLLALSRCGHDETVAVAPAPTATATPTDVVATTPNAGSATALAGTSGLGGYLAGTEAAPRTFQFDKLTFDTAQSTLRPDDAEEVGTIAGVLKQYSNTRVRIAGYADARGSAAANAALGKARADAVKAGLVAQGIDASRIETVSGGESDAVDTNATASGQAENRRTELVVTSR